MTITHPNILALSIFTGGHYFGDINWRRSRTGADNCMYVYYIIKGTVNFYSKGEKFELSAGNLYLINGYKIDRHDAEHSFEKFWFHFVPQSIYLQRAISQLPVLMNLSTFYKEQITPHICKIEELIMPSNTISTDIIRLEAITMLCLIEQIEDYKISIEIKERKEDILGAVITHIEANLYKEFSLADLAKISNLSASHFHHLFTQKFNITPQNYILQNKMKKAKHLLSETKLTIKEVGYQLGYNEQAYFTRVFKRYFYITPSQYREEIKKLP